MIITTHQPIFLPWPGFFCKAYCADAMVLLDLVQFPLGRGWMTRNRLKCDKGELWLTVPVWKKGRGRQIIQNVEICDETDWRTKHLVSLQQQYVHAPYRDDHLPALESIYMRRHRRLVDLNVDLIRYLWDALGMDRRLLLQSELGVVGKGDDLLVAICGALKADTYATLPIVEKYLDTQRFRTHRIGLRFARFRPPVYPQLWGDFRYNLSAFDLLLNCGPKARDIVADSGAIAASPAAHALPATRA